MRETSSTNSTEASASVGDVLTYLTQCRLKRTDHPVGQCHKTYYVGMNARARTLACVRVRVSCMHTWRASM